MADEPVQFEDWELERMKGVAVLSTTSGNGMPHATPVGMRMEDGALRFETQPTSVKFRNISRDPKVSVLFFGQPKWGILVQGVAEVVSPGDENTQPQLKVIPKRKASWRRKEG